MARTGDEADGRRDPEAFLRLIREEAAEEDEPRARGRLKVFFGYAAGWARPTPCLARPIGPRRPA